MSLVGWVTTHTGLPAFYAVGNGELKAEHPHPVSAMPAVSWVVTNVKDNVLVADPGAPPGVPVTYTFGEQTIVLTRRSDSPGDMPDGGGQWVTDIEGNRFANVTLIENDERNYETGAQIFTSALGQQIPRYPLGCVPPSGTLSFLTYGEGTNTLRTFVDAHAPLWVLHNINACTKVGCDVEGARLVVPHSLREARTRHFNKATRMWDITYSRIPNDLATPGGYKNFTGRPVVTWGHWEAWSVKQSISDRGWRNHSTLKLAELVAGKPK